MSMWVAGALVVGSVATGAMGANKEKKAYGAANTLAREGRAHTGAQSRDMMEKVFQRAQTYDPAARKVDRDAHEGRLFDTSKATLATAKPRDTSSLQTAEALSAQGARTAAEGTRMTEIARLLAKVQAPDAQQFRAGVDYGSFDSDLQSRHGDMRRMGNAFGIDTQGRLDKAKSAGQWWNMLSKGLGTAASIYTGGAAGGMAGAAAGGAGYAGNPSGFGGAAGY